MISWGRTLRMRLMSLWKETSNSFLYLRPHMEGGQPSGGSRARKRTLAKNWLWSWSWSWPCSWTCSLQNCEKISFCHLIYSVYGILSWDPELTKREIRLECWKLKLIRQSPFLALFPCTFMHTHFLNCLFSATCIRIEGISHSHFFPDEPEEIFIKTLLKPESQKSQILSTRLYNQNKSYSAMYKVY